MNYCDSSVVDKRNKNDFSTPVLKAIHTLTTNENVLPVGTFKYRIFKYPSDIDIFETLQSCCTFNNAKNSAAHNIQQVIRKVLNDPNMIFSDFKAGYDERFHIYTGVIDDQVVDYNSFYVRRDLSNLRDSNLLDKHQYKYLLSLVKDNPSFDDLVTLNKELRKYWLIRWKPEEILAGYKLLPGNYKLYLDVALSQGSIVKLDGIYKLNDGNLMTDRYVEITNFFNIQQLDRQGNIITLTEELTNYAQSLLEDVYHYYQTNTLKSIKRLWMYLNVTNSICDLSVFTPLFQSQIAQDAQIMGDLEVAINLLGSSYHYDIEFLFQSLQTRLKLLNGRCTQLQFKDPNSSDPEIIKNNLQMIKDCLLDSINERTQKWLSDHNIDINNLIHPSQ